MEHEFEIGEGIKWETIGGTKHEGTIKELDSNVAIIDCIHCKKECCCEL